MSKPSSKPGLRERSKLDKIRRIKAAARKTFAEKGYSRATTREISEKAEVSVGTLFVYVPEKRDLLMMVVNDDLEDLSAAPVRPDQPLLSQLADFYRPRFEFWARDPDLSRHAVRETFEYLTNAEAAGSETTRFRRRRYRVMDTLAGLIEANQAAGRIRPELDAETVAAMIHSIYLSEVRRWLEDERPDVEDGLGGLRHLLELAVAGIMLPPPD